MTNTITFKLVALLVICIFFMCKGPSDLLQVISTCNTFSFYLDCICCLRLSALANTKGFPLLTTPYRFTKK